MHAKLGLVEAAHLYMPESPDGLLKDQRTMDKENGDRDKASASGDANPLMDPLNMFAGHGIFGGALPANYGHHLTNAYSALLGGGRGGQFPPSPHPPTTSAYGSLGTLSVAASQAASLGINPASAAWWTMASHLAAQDYLARLQAAGMPFPGLPADMQSFPLMSPQHSQVSGGSKQSQSSHSKASLSHGHSTASSTATSHHQPSMLNLPTSREGSDPSGVLGGVRLPPDTEIIKYTSSIIGPKVPGTTNRGRKKTISLDPPSVSVTPTHSTSSLSIDRSRKNKNIDNLVSHSQLSPHLQGPLALDPDHRERESELTELMRLQQSVSNGQVTPQASPVPPGYHTPPIPTTANAPLHPPVMDCDAPLNLSLKPASSPQTANNALQSLSSLSQSLGQIPDRISRRKPGPKPRRVSQSPLPPPGPAPSASLAQLFAAADSPRPPSASEDTDSSSHHKDGRPRNLGRGVSKPKKNTVASLLAQSRALGLNSPLNHQVNLLKANILQQQMQAAEGETETEEKNRTSSPSSIVDEMERNKKLLQQASLRSLEELKALVQETYSETSSVPDVSSDTNSDSDSDSEDTHMGSKKREGEPLQAEDIKRQKVGINEDELRIPLLKGWKRETLIKSVGKSGQIRGDVTYKSPCGRRFKQYSEVLRDGRPRNLGRGVSKPKKNTVASLLAQSRALGLNSPLNHQVNLLKANILQQQMQAAEGETETEEKNRTSSPSSIVDEMERNKKLLQQASLRSLEELKALVQETYSETSSVPDVSSDTNSDSDSDSEDTHMGSKKREGEPLQAEDIKRQKVGINEDELRIPLLKGWKRETLIKSVGKSGQIRGDVTYKSPCGRRFKQYSEVLREKTQTETTVQDETHETGSRPGERFSKLTIFHQNTDRISNKIDRINHLLLSLNPDVVVLTEHGQSREKLTNTRLANFSLMAAFGRDHHIKGGVAIYSSTNLTNE
ncbi:hypothetical protein J6590_056414 [Homalodisca vitripennis]|nr:hypothetical protein J6590_056414 [Homalodisca vitripennis]